MEPQLIVSIFSVLKERSKHTGNAEFILDKYAGENLRAIYRLIIPLLQVHYSPGKRLCGGGITHKHCQRFSPDVSQ